MNNTESEQLNKIFSYIEDMDAEIKAWRKMFDMQSKLVTNLELDKIKLEDENKALKKDLELYKDIVRLSDHLKDLWI